LIGRICLEALHSIHVCSVGAELLEILEAGLLQPRVQLQANHKKN